MSAAKKLHTIVAVFSVALGVLLAPVASLAETYEIKMLNKHPDDKKKRNVFIPDFIKIKPGDTLVFVSTDKGHNTESIDGMIPEGVEEWKSKLSKDFEITFDKPGVYGYKCTPHFTLGMVGLVVVEGDGWDANLEEAKKVRLRGKAKKEFQGIWTQLAESQ